jgi:hypothetical protein
VNRPWFFLLPSYWWPVSRRNIRKRTTGVATGGAGTQFLKPPVFVPQTGGVAVVDDEDVAAEREQVLLNLYLKVLRVVLEPLPPVMYGEVSRYCVLNVTFCQADVASLTVADLL